MAQGFEAGSSIAVGAATGSLAQASRFSAARGIFAEVVNDGAGGCDGLRMAIETEACEFGDAELLAQEALGVVVLEGPVFEARLDAAGTFEQRSFRSFEKLLRAGQKRLARVE